GRQGLRGRVDARRSRADLLERAPVLRPLSPGGRREPARGAAADGWVRPLPRVGLRGWPTVCLLARRPRRRRALDRPAAWPGRAGAVFRQRLQPRASYAVA